MWVAVQSEALVVVVRLLKRHLRHKIFTSVLTPLELENRKQSLSCH